MEETTSKDIILLILGIVGSLLLLSMINILGISNINTRENIPMIIAIIIASIIIIFIVYKKFNEVTKELNKQEERQQKLSDRLDIYKELTEMKAEDKYLKDKILELEKRIKNGNKK
ncbi:hypothetical protein HYW76_01195 [Candidatus Pacearchaeota archaeon]|nr:hypothetical protein [Candidatus Pacearchaeota archaeon]